MPDWVRFETRYDSASAAMLRSRLETEGIATRVQIHGVPGLATFNILVPGVLLSRARWIMQQSPPSDAELERLAMTDLPEGEPEE